MQSERFKCLTQEAFAAWEAENLAAMQALADLFADPAEEAAEEVKLEAKEVKVGAVCNHKLTINLLARSGSLCASS